MDIKKLEGDTYVIDYDDWDKLVHNTFEWLANYEIVADREMSNYSYLLLHDIKKESRYQWENDAVRSFLDNKEKRYVNEDTIARAMALMNILPEGNYIIKVFW